MRELAGVVPWLPGQLGRWRWLTEPIPAQRLAAWRIGVGLVLLSDILLFYLPHFRSFYGAGSLGEQGVFSGRFAAPHWNWSVLNWLPADSGPSICLGIWAASAVALVLGWQTKAAALVAWVLSLSFYNTNFYLHNSGDRIRHFLLLLLIFAPSDGAWSVGRKPRDSSGPAFVPRWPVSLMLLQMALMYLMNGIYKMQGRMWWDGSVLYYVGHDIAWSRWPPLPIPYWMSQCLTWFMLAWEAGFPLWILLPSTRVAALVVGAIFHLICFFQLEIAAFPLYALCLYIPLLPWERLCRNAKDGDGGAR